ncbi:uncharacterized protein Dwil_GK20498 [Drosophila willistoni]|uniref:uncharacterized protein LOC6645700 n=1 Tax=Drosophila willistoni TaxID=7260 RepID=UPI00073270CB|nr:uncharacterized protein LOC6645700 [Drosophila willistoni]EDW79476.2 uncharacterized protein Dwil_GK20498 [Drosophila willistoni]
MCHRGRGRLEEDHSRGREVHATIVGIIRQLRQSSPLTAWSESLTWLMPQNCLPIWSRRLPCNIDGQQRQGNQSKWRHYDIEIKDRLWSLWGSLHPRASWFDRMVRGRQMLGCYVIACCAGCTFRRLDDWNSKLLDAIVVNGDKYYRESVQHSERWDHNLQLDDMCMQCTFQDIHFQVQTELTAFGELYSSPASEVMNLSEGLNYFFTRYQWGILECQERRLAFGYTSVHDGGYFIYDCSEWGEPIFPDNMGASYILRAKQLLVLLYCMIVTLNVRRKNVAFRLYKVDIVRNSNSISNSSNNPKLD